MGKVMPKLGTDEVRAMRKRGPVPGVPTRKYNLLLDEELGEWGKQQAGGLSELVRRLLKVERERRTSGRSGVQVGDREVQENP